MVTVYGAAAARYTGAVDERRVRIGSLFEWVAAAACVGALLWIISVPIQRMIGPRVEAAIAETTKDTPPGVPSGATIVPVMLLMDGRELRQGDLHSKLETILPAAAAEGPAQISRAEFGERHTRSYMIDGARFYVVCERAQPNGAMKVAGIYLP
jgi:hypothetical protein